MVTVYATGHLDAISRETTDADIVVNLRVDTKSLEKTHQILVNAGFTQLVSTRVGTGHRYCRGEATIDVLVPEGIGYRNLLRLGMGTTVAARGASRALIRSRRVTIQLDGTVGMIRIPSPVGALVIKGSAFYYNQSGLQGSPKRHHDDIITLLQCCHFSKSELPLSKSEKKIFQKIMEDKNIPSLLRSRLSPLMQETLQLANTQQVPPNTIIPIASKSKRCTYRLSNNRQCKNRTTNPSGKCHHHS